MRLFVFLLLSSVCVAEQPRKTWYPAYVVSIYDGDTLTVNIDQGLGTFRMGERLRLFGVDTPELTGASKPQGLLVRDQVRRKVLGKWVWLQTHDDSRGKYGRLLATLHTLEGVNLNQWLLDNDLAEAYGQ